MCSIKSANYCFPLVILMVPFFIIGGFVYDEGYDKNIGGGRESAESIATVINYRSCPYSYGKEIQVQVTYSYDPILSESECNIDRCCSKQYANNHYAIGDNVSLSIDEHSGTECMSIKQASSIAINGFIILMVGVFILLFSIVVCVYSNIDEYREIEKSKYMGQNFYL
jgi:hypothetical protein